MTKQNSLRRLTELGQSVWLDYIERGFIRDGRLAQLVEADAVSGLTSNPAIFLKAIAEHPVYADAIEALARDGLAAHEIHEALMIDDIRAAADVLASVHAGSAGRDGYVSLEVSPHLARDAEGTYWEAKRLSALVDRANLMIKVPGTTEGVTALRRLVADGINVNVTLLFTVERYAQVAEAFVEAAGARAPFPLAVCALGGSVGTPKTGLTAPTVEVRAIDELDKLGPWLKDKIVFFNRPMDRRVADPFAAYGGAADQRVDEAPMNNPPMGQDDSGGEIKFKCNSTRQRDDGSMGIPSADN